MDGCQEQRVPVRSLHGHFVNASGLRWLSLMLLVPIPLGGAHLGSAVPDGSRPFRALQPREGKRHKKLTDLRQVVLQPLRWLSGRDLVLVANSSFAALELRPC